MHPESLARHVLPGTIALPSPFPTVGKLSIEECDERYTISIVHDTGRHFSITRKVYLTDVAAIQIVSPPSMKQWFFARGYLNPAEKILSFFRSTENNSKEQGQSEAVIEGIVYVAESAPVLNHVEFGTTAADSSDYYPPTSLSKMPACTVPPDPPCCDPPCCETPCCDSSDCYVASCENDQKMRVD